MDTESVCRLCEGTGAVIVRVPRREGSYRFTLRAELCLCSREKIRRAEEEAEEIKKAIGGER